MFNSLSDIFQFQPPQTQRKYTPKTRLLAQPNLVQRKKFALHKRDPAIFQGILDFLPTPIENWALQHQKTFYSFALHQWIYNEIVSFSTSFKQKQSAGFQQNELTQQLIRQVRLQQNLSAPNFKKPQISLHNIFVLMTQYKVMQQIIYNLNTEELEMIVDGLSFIYFHGVGKVQDIGEVFSEEEITIGVGSWGTIDELTCCIHFITTHTKLYKTYPQKEKYSMMKEINILKMPYFIKVYDCLQQNKKIDNIVNSIPMFMEFLQIFVKHKNNSVPGCQFVINVKWLSGLGHRIMEIINYNINKLLLINNECNEEFSVEELEMIAQLQNVNEQNEKEESQIVLKLTQKAMLLKQTEGRINCRVLFSYAYHHLYTVNFMLKLTRKVLQLSKSHYQVYNQTCQEVQRFMLKLFESVHKYEFTLPENSLGEICEMIKIMSNCNQGEYVFGMEEREVRGFEFLYGNEIGSGELKAFAKKLQKSERFGCYHNHKPRPKISSNSEMLGSQIAEDYNVVLETNEHSILYFLLSSIYTMRMDYLTVVQALLKHADRRYLQLLQFYFIKNELLHFLVQNQHQVQLKDKKNIKLLYNTIAYLLKANYVAYAIIDEIVSFSIEDNTKRIQFVEDLKKHFPETKELMLIMLSDNITVNSKFPETYSYSPFILSRLLHEPNHDQTYLNPIQTTKHQVWISYIFNVILHQLFTVRKKFQDIENKTRKTDLHQYQNLLENLILVQPQTPKHSFQTEIYEWTTLIILLHIDYTQQKRQSQPDNDQLILAQFVMTYLTTILSEAIKWKYKNESERMVEFMKCLQDWENHYTDQILNQENNEDVLEKEYGGAIKFLMLKRWNKKIIKAINLYLDSIDEYNRAQRIKRKSLEKVKSLKNLIKR